MVLVGSPNVGKSVIFNYLTGQYVTVANYPGTTVDISRGYSKINGKRYEVVDTPGIYSLLPITEEEKVTRNLLCLEKADIIIHVIDGKNIQRMLNMTLQLIDAGFPVMLDINLMDEAKEYGIYINLVKLSEILNIPVVGTMATKKIGLSNLKQLIGQYSYSKKTYTVKFTAELEEMITEIENLLRIDYGLSPRMVALLLLQRDESIHHLASKEFFIAEILTVVKKAATFYEYDMEYVLTVERQMTVDAVCSEVLEYRSTSGQNLGDKLGKITREPLTGIPILLIILFLGLYQFVGKFGAGFLVDYMDTAVFSQYIYPFVKFTIDQYIPWEWLQSLIIGQYGIFSLGFRYAFVIVLPIIGSFFLLFAIIEDSGYLPRVAMLLNKIFKPLGLNGRAVIPFALGLGCGTMAVMVTRTLETRRERLLATFLLSLAIPCSAQLGVILALLSHSPVSLVIWGMYIGMIFTVVGWLNEKILYGASSAFYMEIPPLRLPQLSNIVNKAFIRMWWYFIEILPVFMMTSLIIWCGERSGLLLYLVQSVEPVMILLGLPIETAHVFLLGFFRRDYGAAGLYDLFTTNSLTNEQLLTCSVILTLFMPCIAQVAVMIKERGWLIAAMMIMIILCIAFFAGWLLHCLLYLGKIHI
ncbi:ferrous iron transport protein B [Pelosinus sp. sgz500959]|uniref:ferrous iron transport protein B n=1 Tax=Pelosinus sp. sgz500959 TaxID=3242472 RepID=UPI003672E198